MNLPTVSQAAVEISAISFQFWTRAEKLHAIEEYLNRYSGAQQEALKKASATRIALELYIAKLDQTQQERDHWKNKYEEILATVQSFIKAELE